MTDKNITVSLNEEDGMMSPEKLTEFVNKRVDNLKDTSAAYRYYKNTPLHELKNREEKLIKKEIERREKVLLLEDDKEVLKSESPRGDMFATSSVSPRKYSEPTFPASGDVVRGTGNTYVGSGTPIDSRYQPDVNKDDDAIGTGNTMKGQASAPGSLEDSLKKTTETTGEPSLFGQIMDFIMSIPERFMGLFGEGSALHTAYNNIVSYVQGITNKFRGEGSEEVSKDTAAAIVDGTFVTAVAVLGLVACWKLIKRFITRNGDVEEPGAAAVATAESKEFHADESYSALDLVHEDVDNIVSGPANSHVKKYADKMLSDLLNDETFVKFMSKHNSKLLESLKKFKKEDPEALAESWFMDGIAVNTSNTTPSFFAMIGAQISNFFFGLGANIRDGVMYLSKKVTELQEALGKGGLDTALYATASMALLAIATVTMYKFWKANKDKKESTAMVEESGYLFLDKISQVSKVLEESKVLSSVAKDVNFPEDLKGSGEKLANKLVDRVRSISASMITDKDFVAFARKANPEVLSYMKSLNKDIKGQ